MSKENTYFGSYLWDEELMDDSKEYENPFNDEECEDLAEYWMEHSFDE